MSATDSSKAAVPALVGVTPQARQIWEDYRNAIEAQAGRHFSMPATFQMIPLKMSILNHDGIATYFFKARVPNNKFVNVRVRLSGDAESRDEQVAVEAHSSTDLEAEIAQPF